MFDARTREQDGHSLISFIPSPIFELIGPYCFLYTRSNPASPRTLFPAAVASIPSRTNVVSKSGVFSVAARSEKDASITRGTPMRIADLKRASFKRRTTSWEGVGALGPDVGWIAEVDGLPVEGEVEDEERLWGRTECRYIDGTQVCPWPRAVDVAAFWQ